MKKQLFKKEPSEISFHTLLAIPVWLIILLNLMLINLQLKKNSLLDPLRSFKKAIYIVLESYKLCTRWFKNCMPSLNVVSDEEFPPSLFFASGINRLSNTINKIKAEPFSPPVLTLTKLRVWITWKDLFNNTIKYALLWCH